MPAAPFEDLDDFLDVEEFATKADFKDPDGVTVKTGVVGIFDDPYLNAETSEYDHDTSDPRFAGKLADFTGIGRGYSAVIDGVEYDVLTEPQSDGAGWGTLHLAPKP